MIVDEREDAGFQNLLRKIHEEGRVDFSQYSVAHLKRRIGARLKAHGVAGYRDYLAILSRDPDEYKRLFGKLSIKVTEFFRNPEAWRVLKDEVLPELIRYKRERGLKTIRVWSAGTCAGEEAYTAAIILHEVLGPELYDFKPIVYGTDMDKEALLHAANGRYHQNSLKRADRNILRGYFERSGDFYIVNDRVRLFTKFLFHNLVASAPFRRIDLLICRNVTIYFSKQLQSKIYNKFYHAINNGGYLMLGKSESLPKALYGHLKAVDNRERIYRKT